MDNRLKLGVFAAGVVSLLAQVLLLRELAVAFYGNELVLGVALGCWLLWTGLGSLVLSRLVVSGVTPETARRRAAVLLPSAGLMLPVGLAVVRLSGPTMGIEMGTVCGLWPALAASLAASAPVGLLFGMLFGLFTKASGSPGRVYVLEAFGSAMGGLGYTSALAGLGHPEIVAGCLAALTAMAGYGLSAHGRAGMAQVFGGRSYHKIIGLVCLAASLFTLVAPWGALEDFAWRPLNPAESIDSKYGRLTLTEAGEGPDAVRSLFVNGLLAWSYPDPPAAESLVHYSLLQCREPRRVLLVGGGVRGTAVELLKHPIEHLVYVELDPTVIDLARRHLPGEATAFLSDPRVEVRHADGRRVLKTSDEKFDAIVVDLPRPYTAQINRFYTVEFFREASERLTDHGVLCFSVGAPPTYYSDPMRRFLACLTHSLRTSFDDVLVIPGTELIFLAANGEGALTADAMVLAERMVEREITTLAVAPYQIADRMSDFRLEHVREAIDEAGTVPLNTDLAPVCYYYDAVLWSTKLSRRGEGRPLLSAFYDRYGRTGGGLNVIAWGAVAVFCLVLGGVEVFKRNLAVVLRVAVCATGFVEILMEVCCLLLLQSLFGFVYEMIGAVLCSFMLGLTAGGRLSTRGVERGGWGLRHFVGVQTAVVAYPLMLWAVATSMHATNLSGLAAACAFCVLTFIAGVIGGMQFPLAVKLIEIRSRRTGRVADGESGVAARLYGLDLLGSCAGALIVSSLLLPIAGMPGCLLLASGLGFAVLICVLVGASFGG